MEIILAPIQPILIESPHNTLGLIFMEKGRGGCGFMHANFKAGISKDVCFSSVKIRKVQFHFLDFLSLLKARKFALSFPLHFPFLLTQNEIRMNRHSPVWVPLSLLKLDPFNT